MDILELVQKSQKGDTQAFGQIYDDFAQKIFRYLKLKVSTQEQAEDLLQETFIKAWQGLPKFKSQHGNFSAWLYKIATNAVNDYYRKVYRRPQLVELEQDADIKVPQNEIDAVDQQLQREFLKKGLTALPLSYQQVLELRFIQDFSVKETAEILGKSQISVRITQHRALKKLRIILTSNYETSEYFKI